MHWSYKSATEKLLFPLFYWVQQPYYIIFSPEVLPFSPQWSHRAVFSLNNSQPKAVEHTKAYLGVLVRNFRGCQPASHFQVFNLTNSGHSSNLGICQLGLEQENQGLLEAKPPGRVFLAGWASSGVGGCSHQSWGSAAPTLLLWEGAEPQAGVGVGSPHHSTAHSHCAAGSCPSAAQSPPEGGPKALLGLQGHIPALGSAGVPGCTQRGWVVTSRGCQSGDGVEEQQSWAWGRCRDVSAPLTLLVHGLGIPFHLPGTPSCASTSQSHTPYRVRLRPNPDSSMLNKLLQAGERSSTCVNARAPALPLRIPPEVTAPDLILF